MLASDLGRGKQRLSSYLICRPSKTLVHRREAEGANVLLHSKHIGMNFRVKRFVASAPKFLRKMGQAQFSLVRFAPALAGPCARSTQ